MIKVHLPELGENISKATVSYWHIEEGATITEGDDLVEVATDKATFNVPAPCSGTLLEIIAHEGDDIHPGDILGMMEEDVVMKDKTDNEEEL
jgi:pyruvate/2-oxoglutarate dehydrogenase complex dihydrolipoamide acyltransferase (E2) component